MLDLVTEGRIWLQMVEQLSLRGIPVLRTMMLMELSCVIVHWGAICTHLPERELLTAPCAFSDFIFN